MRTLGDALGGVEVDESGRKHVARTTAKPCKYCGAQPEYHIGPDTGTVLYVSAHNCCPEWRAARARAGSVRYP